MFILSSSNLPVVQQDKVVIGVAYDCVDKIVYWTDISGPSISRASLHGGEPTTIIKTGNSTKFFLLLLPRDGIRLEFSNMYFLGVA